MGGGAGAGLCWLGRVDLVRILGRGGVRTRGRGTCTIDIFIYSYDKTNNKTMIYSYHKTIVLHATMFVVG